MPFSFEGRKPEEINTFKFEFGKSGYWISGPNTYGCRGKFHEFGAEWNKFKGAWYIKDPTGEYFEKITVYLSNLSFVDKELKIIPIDDSGFYLKGGDTYRFRFKIRTLGGEWRAGEKSWFFKSILKDEVCKEFKLGSDSDHIVYTEKQ